ELMGNVVGIMWSSGGVVRSGGHGGLKTTIPPMEPNKELIKDAEAKDVDVHLYISMMRSLMYLTASSPDITFVVCACARGQINKTLFIKRHRDDILPIQVYVDDVIFRSTMKELST
nr:hypothetical protein [Tanacetum cinerariifolium]